MKKRKEDIQNEVDYKLSLIAGEADHIFDLDNELDRKIEELQCRTAKFQYEIAQRLMSIESLVDDLKMLNV